MPSYFDSSDPSPRAIRTGDPGASPSAGAPFTPPDAAPKLARIEPGSFTPPLVEATVVPYTPAAPLNWPAPGPWTVAQALDDLAAEPAPTPTATARTIASGATAVLLPTDTVVRFDTTGGTTATADMVAGSFIGQRVTFYWWAWGVGQVPPTINAPAGQNVVPFTGQATSGAAGLVTTTTISTPGASFTLVWDGTEWVMP